MVVERISHDLYSALVLAVDPFVLTLYRRPAVVYTMICTTVNIAGGNLKPRTA